MSLLDFDLQGGLFESLTWMAADLFEETDKYKLFATKIWPLLAESRPELRECYREENGRPGIEPVVLLGVLILQFLERVPDRQAAELAKYHLGWKLALNLKISYQGFHPTVLTKFRERLERCEKRDVAMRTIVAALQKEGLVAKRSKQRLDSTHILGAVARLSALECVRETLALALEELAGPLAAAQERPEFWDLLWERYVESKLDYKSSEVTLRAKSQQAGVDCLRLLQWLEPLGTEIRQGRQVLVLREVWPSSTWSSRGRRSSRLRCMALASCKIPMIPVRNGQLKVKADRKRTGWVTKCRWPRRWLRKAIRVVLLPRSLRSEPLRAMMPGCPQRWKNKNRWASNARRRCTLTELTSLEERFDQAKEEGWQLVGPAQPSASRAGLEKAYRIEAFDISITERKALCPEGRPAPTAAN
jgi:hypothetical protein